MKLNLKKNKYYLAFFLVFIVGMLAGNIYKLPYKHILKLTYQKEYQKHMYRCDNAMRTQFISKARAAKEPSNKSAKDLLASEIALIDCHDYDVFRKKLLTLGLTELDLSSIGLKAIEKEAYDLQKLVRIHEIRY